MYALPKLLLYAVCGFFGERFIFLYTNLFHNMHFILLHLKLLRSLVKMSWLLETPSPNFKFYLYYLLDYNNHLLNPFYPVSSSIKWGHLYLTYSLNVKIMSPYESFMYTCIGMYLDLKIRELLTILLLLVSHVHIAIRMNEQQIQIPNPKLCFL